MATSPQTSGPWDTAQVEAFLTHEVIPVRLATSGRTGAMVESLWFDYRDGFIWCSTQADSVLLRRLRHDPRAGFEVAPDAAPYHGVRGRALVEIVHLGAAEVLNRLIDKYLDDPSSNLARWMRSRQTTEVALRLNPLTIHSWDNSARLSAASQR
jgi:hypothetical protein